MASYDELAPDTERDGERDTARDTMVDTDAEADPSADPEEPKPPSDLPAYASRHTLPGIGSEPDAPRDDELSTLPISTEPELPTVPLPPAVKKSSLPIPPPPSARARRMPATLPALPPPPVVLPAASPVSLLSMPDESKTEDLSPVAWLLPPPSALPQSRPYRLPSPPRLPPVRPSRTKPDVFSAVAAHHVVAPAPYVRPPPPDEHAPAVRGASEAPVALATLRPPPEHGSRRRIGASLMMFAVGGLLAGGIWFALHQSGKRAVADGVARLSVVADGSPLEDVRILVDGVERCTTSPCTVSGLERGAHLVSAVAAGHLPSAARAFAVQTGQPATVSIELARTPAPVAAAPVAAPPELARPASAPEAEVAPGPASPKQELASAATFEDVPKPRSKRAAAAKPAPRGRHKAAAPAGRRGTLSLNGAPGVSVVLDGRPLGKVPIAAVPVSPGRHSIVFVHPDGRRKRRIETVTPGQKRSVAARF
jgi:hypothetical protein